MVFDSRLDTTKDYVWFLSNVETRTIKKQPTMIFDWSCKTVDVTVKEYLRVPKQLEGSRILETMIALGYDTKDTTLLARPEQFFEKGLHMKAKPLRYWSELNSEDMKWKLNYETLSPMKEKVASISNVDMITLERLCSAKGEHNAVLAHLATHRIELIEPFIQLSKEGKLKFGK